MSHKYAACPTDINLLQPVHFIPRLTEDRSEPRIPYLYPGWIKMISLPETESVSGI